MPFKSEKQRRFLWKNHPDIAKRWTQEAAQRKLRNMNNDNKSKRH